MTALWIYIAALPTCAINAVEWAAARNHYRLFKILTLTTACLALITAIAAVASGHVSVVAWYGAGCVIIFAGYYVFRAVTRKA